MSIIFMLIPLTLVLVGAACWAFFWAVGSGQFDDLDTPAWDVLADDANPAESQGTTSASSQTAPRV
jgi:cbb3-type cytochrome oxidase maturation protein